MNNNKLRDHVGRILHESAIRSFSFSLQGANVNGPELAEIGRQVLKGSIAVRVDASLESSGEFDYLSNTLFFKSDNPDRGTILHESIHALLHHHKCTKTTDITHEVAAYLAEVIYYLREGLIRRERFQKSFTLGSTQSIYQEAIRLIDKHQILRKSVYLKWGDYQGLRNAIKAHPTYIKPQWQ